MEIDVEAQLELISWSTATRLGNGLQGKGVWENTSAPWYTSLSVLQFSFFFSVFGTLPGMSEKNRNVFHFTHIIQHLLVYYINSILLV